MYEITSFVQVKQPLLKTENFHVSEMLFQKTV